MSTRFFTNDNSNTLLKKFEGIFEHNSDLARFDALNGCLRASGYFAIRPKLVNVPVVRILDGINVDNIVEKYLKKGQLFLADAGKALKEYRAVLATDIKNAHLTQEEATATAAKDKTAAPKEREKLQKALKDCHDWERNTIFPPAQQRLEIDHDDGVKVNYLKFTGAVQPIPGLAAKED